MVFGSFAGRQYRIGTAGGGLRVFHDRFIEQRQPNRIGNGHVAGGLIGMVEVPCEGFGEAFLPIFADYLVGKFVCVLLAVAALERTKCNFFHNISALRCNACRADMAYWPPP